ncbi:putative polyadenylate-binding protein [Spironucleus salmonicida]|uniref:Polyadenylate-binding protein n=1 Tax=Spironucleus salmonicida TaxID=348837 RepID=V6LBX8_9EUKA|nr:putative polyadenylate-binding protein [Spironucleus salmonicida]|eukprot:EST42005.1 Putative polyadenylate-binding protein [Spironucleus salmonicida]
MSRIFIKNIPASATELQIKEHFQQIGNITDTQIITNSDKTSRCIGYIGFAEATSAERAVKLRSNTYIGGRKIQIQIAVSHKVAQENQLKDQKKQKNLSQGARALAEQLIAEGGDLLKQYLNTGSGWEQNIVVPQKQQNNQKQLQIDSQEARPAENGEIDDSKIKISNLPTLTTTDQIQTHFAPFGEISDVVLATNPLTKQPTGVAYVQFALPEAAKRAVLAQETQINGKFVRITQGRTSAIQEFIRTKEYKAKGFDKNNKLAWNPLIQRQQNIVDALQAHLGDKAALIQDSAVTLAAAEAYLQKELKAAFKAENIAFSPSHNRSKNVILCKNLPISTVEKDVKQLFEQFGIVVYCKAFFAGFCIVKFAENGDARRAFGKLCFKKMGNEKVPMMLEFACVLSAEEQVQEAENAALKVETEAKMDQMVSVCIRNISFATDKTQIEHIIKEQIQQYEQITIPQNEISHKGYCFVTVQESQLNKVISALSQVMQDGFRWEPQKARATVSQNNTNSTRLMIKNLAFQANQAELRQLLNQFGKVAALRCPKNLDGGLRGFAFVEYSTSREAREAIEGINGVHFYGRRLVIEVAKEEEQGAKDGGQE